jgi:hypothetical protein
MIQLTLKLPSNLILGVPEPTPPLSKYAGEDDTHLPLQHREPKCNPSILIEEDWWIA